LCMNRMMLKKNSDGNCEYWWNELVKRKESF
jgi:hypothetical protein